MRLAQTPGVISRSSYARAGSRASSRRRSSQPRRLHPSIDLAGCFLLPGLTDAHVHFALTEPNGAPTQPWAEWAARVSAFIAQTLDQGFTTVRDAGALDPAWARVVEKGLVRGPRILPSGAFISQTGG